MATRRVRRNRSVGNKLNDLESRVVSTEKKTIQESSIGSTQIATQGVATDNVQDRAVTSNKIELGAISTEHLSLINAVSSGGDFAVNTGEEGHLTLNGVKYESPYDSLGSTTGLYTVAFDPATNAILVYPQEPGAGGGGGSNVTVSSTAPVSPSEGDIWVYDVDGSSYVWYTDGTSDQWMQIGASTAAYPPAAFLDVLSFGLTATVTKISVSTSATPRFIHPEIIASSTTDSFQVTKAGYYEFGFEGAATSVESGNRVALQAYVSTTSPPATAGAAYRDVRTFDSAVAAGTIAVNGSWFAYLTTADYVAFYASCNTTDGTLSTSGQVYIRRIG